MAELMDKKKLKKTFRKRCVVRFRNECEMDDCDGCGIMDSMLEGAAFFEEELKVKTIFDVDPSDPKSECPFESFQRSEAWCMLKDGFLCHRTDCPLKKVGAVLVRTG